MGFYNQIHDNKRFSDIILLEFVISQCSNNAWNCELGFMKDLVQKFNNTISLSCHEQVCLSGLRFERYFSHHREKYLSKRSPLKHIVHDLINLLYYECWTDKQKYLYVYQKFNILDFIDHLSCLFNTIFILFSNVAQLFWTGFRFRIDLNLLTHHFIFLPHA